MVAPVPESVSIAGLIDYLAEGVQTYAEQQWGQSVSLVYATFDGDLCKSLAIGLKGGFPQPHRVGYEGS